MNVFRFELKSNKKSILTWAISMSAICLFFMPLFPTFSSDIDATKALLKDFPPEALKALGLDLNTFFSILGFYAYTFTFILLCGAIGAMNIGLGVISKEVRNKTADFLMTKPLSRTRILTEKIFATLTSIAIINVIYLAISSISVSIFKTEDFSIGTLLLISLSLFFIQLIFAAMGILIAILFRRIKSVVSVSLSVVFGFYIVGMLDAILDKEILKYFIPFKYFDTQHILSTSTYELPFVLLTLAVITVCLIFSYVIYNKKDIHSV